MTTRATPPEIDEAEWQAQERARIGAPDADAADLRVARALRQAPAIDLPPDFAAQVAGLVRAQAVNDSQFEQRLLRILSLLLGVSAVVTVAWFGRGWPAELAAVLPGGAESAGWTLLAGLCALGNWGLGLLRQGTLGHFSKLR